MYPESFVSRQFVASPGFAGIGPKFSATRSTLLMYGFVAIFALPMVAFFVLGDSPELAENLSTYATPALGTLLVLVMVGGVTWYWWRGKRRFVISVAGDALTIDKRPGDVYRFGDARLGRWGMNDATTGTVLHLHSGRDRFVLGGRDHRVGEGTRLDEPPIIGVDAWLTAPEFDELLAIIRPNSGLDVRPVTPGGPVRCLLFPNGMKVQQMSYLTAVRKQRQMWKAAARASLAIDVDAQGVRVIDPTTNAQIASAGNGQWTATPATYQYSVSQIGRLSVGGILTKHLSVTPEMVINLAGMPPLTIACRDAAGVSSLQLRFSWRGDVPQRIDDPADYSVTGGDWLILVEKFGLTPYLETHG